MEALIIEINRTSCYDMIEQYCQCILNQLPSIEKHRYVLSLSLHVFSFLLYYNQMVLFALSVEIACVLFSSTQCICCKYENFLHIITLQPVSLNAIRQLICPILNTLLDSGQFIRVFCLVHDWVWMSIAKWLLRATLHALWHEQGCVFS